MIYSISPWKAAKGHIMPGLCQVNNTWLEPTYYIYPCFKAPPPLKAIPSLTLPPTTPEAAGLGSMLPPSLALGMNASNTCAKCGVTFRMTSDLVYHMRTHHSKPNQMR